MLDEGLIAGLEHLGIQGRVVCHVERDAYAAAALVARMEGKALAPAPVWDDLKTFPGRAFRGVVDCVSAGFPCQDLSVAGARAGLGGKRSGLFFDCLDIAEACGAYILWLENVAGIATAGSALVDETFGELTERAAARVVGELADRGWSAEWLHLPASQVGARHGRERWFCLAWRVAHARCAGDERRGEPGAHEISTGAPQGQARQRQRSREHAGLSRLDVADPSRLPSREWPGRERVLDGGSAMGDTQGERWGEGRTESGGVAGRFAATVDGGELAHPHGSGSARIGGRRQAGTAECGAILGHSSSPHVPRGGGMR